MSFPRKKRQNRLLALAAVLILVFVALFSNQSQYFKGLFYFESEQEDSVIVENLEIPSTNVDQPVKLSIQKSDNSPSIIQFEGNKSSEELLGVFEIKPEKDIAEISTIAASIAGESIVLDPSNITAKVYLMHKPRCEEEAVILCGESPAPQAEFKAVNALVNEKNSSDIVVKLVVDQPFEIDKEDWRHEAIGDTYYLALYGTIEKSSDFSKIGTGTLVTGIKYLGDSKGSYQTTGTPTGYSTANIY